MLQALGFTQASMYKHEQSGHSIMVEQLHRRLCVSHSFLWAEC